MLYYCIYKKEIYEKILNSGYIEGNRYEYMFPKEYDWLMNQMEKRIYGYKKEDGLVFLWTQKPDLRSSGHLNRGEEGVLIEVDLPKSKVLLSNFMAWHCVLNDIKAELHEDEKIDKFKSWERIFDLELCSNEKSSYFAYDDKVQGCTAKISIKNIKSIRFFKAK